MKYAVSAVEFISFFILFFFEKFYPKNEGEWENFSISKINNKKMRWHWNCKRFPLNLLKKRALLLLFIKQTKQSLWERRRREVLLFAILLHSNKCLLLLLFIFTNLRSKSFLQFKRFLPFYGWTALIAWFLIRLFPYILDRVLERCTVK